jgi:LacI family transcriptional regulator
VSRVVNGASAVRPATAERVNRAIGELGFRPNDIARALRPGMTSRLIAVLLGDLTNPFYAEIAETAVALARGAGYALVVASADEDRDAEERAVQQLLDRRIAGLVIVPHRGDHSFLASLQRTDTPIVFIDRPASGVTADVVLLDNDQGGYLATTHLFDHGHRRVAILVAPSYYTTGRRRLGYRRAFRAAGLETDPSLIVALRDGSADAARAATRELLSRPDPPTAIFATTNFACEGALRAVGELRRRVAVVGFDDFRLADMLPVPATVVSGDVAEMARRATQLLLARIGGVDGPPEREVLPVALTVRGSGEIRPR